MFRFFLCSAHNNNLRKAIILPLRSQAIGKTLGQSGFADNFCCQFRRKATLNSKQSTFVFSVVFWQVLQQHRYHILYTAAVPWWTTWNTCIQKYNLIFLFCDVDICAEQECNQREFTHTEELSGVWIAAGTHKTLAWPLTSTSKFSTLSRGRPSQNLV